MRLREFEQWHANADQTGKSGHVGTTSGSGGAERFVSPEESKQIHLTPPEPDKPTSFRAPMETAGLVDIPTEPSLDGTEAGPNNPTRGTD